MLLDCAAPVSEAEALAVLEQFRQTPELTNDLRFWMVNVSNGLTLMKDIHREVAALSQGVATERAR